MSVFNILPDSPLDKNDVRDTLNANGGSVGNKLVSSFTRGASINMWSKYKPVVAPLVRIPLDLWKKEWYRGSDGKCGLTILSKECSMDEFRQYLESGEALWTYIPPRGGTSEPRRLGDFRGYNPKAENPIGQLVTSGYSEHGRIDVEGNVEFSVEVLDSMQNNLTYGDIRIGGKDGVPLTDFYFGIYAWNNTTWRYKTNIEPLGENYNFNIKLPLTVGEWRIAPFFCSVPQTGDEGKGIYVGANVPVSVFTIISTNEKIVFSIFGMWNASKTKVQNIYASIENQSGDSVTMTNIGVSLRGISAKEDYGVGNPDISYYRGSSASTIVIPANTTIMTNIGDFDPIGLVDVNPNYEYKLRATGKVGDNLYSNVSDIEEEERRNSVV